MSVHKAKALAELELAFCGSDSELEGKCIAGAIFKVFNALSLPSERRQKLLMEVVSHLNEEAIRCGELVSICPMEDASKSRDSFVVECLDDSFLQTEPNQRVKDTSNLVPIICGHSNSDSSKTLLSFF